MHQSTIIRHIEEYKKGKLKNQSGGSSHLTDEQTQELVAHLEEHTYAHNHQIVLYNFWILQNIWDFALVYVSLIEHKQKVK